MPARQRPRCPVVDGRPLPRYIGAEEQRRGSRCPVAPTRLLDPTRRRSRWSHSTYAAPPPARCTACVFGLALAGAGLAAAQEAYPTRPIEFIVPWGPGGGADQVARKSGVMLEAIAQGVVPGVNVAGASGQTGLPKMLAAAPDGYTISIMTGDTFGTLAAGKPSWKFSDITPVAHHDQAAVGVLRCRWAARSRRGATSWRRRRSAR